MGLTIEGLIQSEDWLTRVGDRASDLTPILAVVGQDLLSLVDDSFSASRSPDGTPWEPLSPSTIARRRGRSSKPLIDTGRLRRSITSRVEVRALEIGSNVAYAPTHQLGSRHVPARPFLPFVPVGAGFVMMGRGPAGEEFELASQAIIRYIATGEIG